MDPKVSRALSDLQQIRFQIKDKQIELQELREIAGSVPAVSGNMDKGGSGSGDRTSSLAIRMVTLQEEIAALQQVYMEHETALRQKIESLPSMECHILMMRFIGNADFKDIADDIVYSERNMFRIYNKAQKHLAELL